MVRGKKASLTVEAALVTPLFIVVVLAFCFFFRLMQVENMLQDAISRTAEDIASYGYAYSCLDAVAEKDFDKILSGIPLASTAFRLLSNYADDYAIKMLSSRYVNKDLLEKGRVVDGWDGISFSKSSLNDVDNCVSVLISYKVEFPFVSKIFPTLTVSQKASAGQFSGRISIKNPEQDTSDATIVYVTPNGTVYHTFRDCTHLCLSTETVGFSEMGTLRNYKGGKYYPCEQCVRGKKTPDSVYIYYYGDRYHYKSDCISLRRTVIETMLGEVNLPLCSRCAERSGSGE